MMEKILPYWMPYELRRLGRFGLTTPVLVTLLFVVGAALAALAGAEEWQVARNLTAGLELGLSLAAGLVAAHVVTSDPATDLQLSVRTHYRTTLLRRLALIVSWTALFALAWASVLKTLGLCAVPGPFLLGQLAWVAPLSWFVSTGALFALLFRSRALASAVLGLLWIFENSWVGVAGFLNSYWLRPFFLFATTHAPGADFWLGNRLALICLSLVLFGVSVFFMGGESSFTGGEE